MKKTLQLLICLAACSPQFTDAQNRCINEGGNNIGVYYGVDLVRMYYSSVLKGKPDLDISGAGPLGIIYEHVVTRKFGFGVELGYGQTDISYSEKISTYNDQYKREVSRTYTNHYTITNLRAQLRMNFHFVNTKYYDVYNFLCAGYGNTTIVSSSTNPNSTNESSSSLLPVGMKAGIGIRHMSGNMGIFIEVAAGTPFMSLGLTYKFKDKK